MRSLRKAARIAAATLARPRLRMVGFAAVGGLPPDGHVRPAPRRQIAESLISQSTYRDKRIPDPVVHVDGAPGSLRSRAAPVRVDGDGVARIALADANGQIGRWAR